MQGFRLITYPLLTIRWDARKLGRLYLVQNLNQTRQKGISQNHQISMKYVEHCQLRFSD